METMNDDNSLSFDLSASILLAGSSYKVRMEAEFAGGEPTVLCLLITNQVLPGDIVTVDATVHCNFLLSFVGLFRSL